MRQSYFKNGLDTQEKHRQDACATAKRGETPGENTGKMPVLLPRGARRPGKTQARCLCYCQEGRDAQGKHRQDACATAKRGETPGESTGKMPVLLPRRSSRPGKAQARCLCYCQEGRAARGKHRQDACATAKRGEPPGKNTGKMPVLLPRGAKRPGKAQARCLCYCQEGRDAQGKHRQDACATAKRGETPRENTGKMPVLLR
jgi:hypothetical protein